MSLPLAIVVAAAVIASLNAIAVLVLWFRVDDKRGRVEDLRHRVVLLEDRFDGLRALRSEIEHIGRDVAAMKERSGAMSMQLQSIEEYLRGTR